MDQLRVGTRCSRAGGSSHASPNSDPELSKPGPVSRIGASCMRIRTSRSEEHTSELQSLMRSSYAVFCLKKTIHYKGKILNRTTKHPSTPKPITRNKASQH